MELDGRAVVDGTTFEAEVCVVGSGPAGLTVARQLAAAGIEVVVLESGGVGVEPAALELNEGTLIGGPYAGLRRTRYRRVGGTPHLWNTVAERRAGWGRYVPLDPWDFHAGASGGWPFGREHLEPFYRRAQALCGVEGAWDATTVAAPGREPLPLPAGTLVTGIYRFGDGSCWTSGYVRELHASRNARLIHSATALPPATDAHGRVGGIEAATDGGRFTVRARSIVLACSAVETARLLLAAPAGSPWLEHGQVGLRFNEHPRDYAMRLVPASRDLFRTAAFYDAHRAPDGGIVCGRLGPSAEARAEGWPNFAVSLLPHRRPGIRDRLRARLTGRPFAQPGHGWAETPGAWRAFRLVLNLEQRPDPSRRIVLGPERDRHGVPRAELHWHRSPAEQGELERLRVRLREWFSAAGLGRLEWRPGAPADPNACHHAGTARMSDDPRLGVVDAHGRVHGTPDLYVAGGATFPRDGFANPALTVVAMACRLADHLTSGER